ncbi:PQQ-binding-like beta-propeller repeat protein [Tundrisphaera lichenicola]|uniref:outer membrane protein assembly factor BamB family protein n=1 Tax=Tundrisphaera lichenicola TaxID=2029860 RepID=UPI003EB6F84E
MAIDQLIFVGLNGYVAALHRETGEIVWSNKTLRKGSVTLLLDDDLLIVSSNGYLYGLDPETGTVIWHNPMKGFGMGVPTALASVRGQVNISLIEQVVAMQQAASSATS